MKKISTQVELLETIKHLISGKQKPRALSKEVQNMIIEYLRYEEGLSQAKIAQLLNLVTDTIRARIKKIDEGYRQTLVTRGFDAWSIVAEAKRKKEIVQQKAGQQGNWGLVWKSETDFVAMLITLNLIKETAQEEMEIEEEYKNMSAKELRELYQKAKLENEEASQTIEEEH